MNSKTLKEHASDLKHFIGWFETADYQEEEVLFRIEDVAIPTLTRYREAAQKVMELIGEYEPLRMIANDQILVDEQVEQNIIARLQELSTLIVS